MVGPQETTPGFPESALLGRETVLAKVAAFGIYISAQTPFQPCLNSYQLSRSPANA